MEDCRRKTFTESNDINLPNRRPNSTNELIHMYYLQLKLGVPQVYKWVPVRCMSYTVKLEQETNDH